MTRRATALRVLLLSAGLILGAASAAPPLPDLATVLLAGDTPEDLQARLQEHATRLERDNPGEASAALRLAARSYERSGYRDSAIAALRRARALSATTAGQIALADLLLKRRHDGDIAAAIDELMTSPGDQVDRQTFANIQGLLAWAQSLSDAPDSAFALFRPVSATLLRAPEWRYRAAKIFLDTHRYTQSMDAIRPLSIEARLQDTEVNALVSRLGDVSGAGGRLAAQIEGELGAQDRKERQALVAMHASRVRFFADDGFGLGGVIVNPEGKSRRPAVVVLAAPGDPVAVHDSLLMGLRHAGFAAIVLDVRGSGWSVAPACPLMETWEGRQQRLVRMVAGDVRAALGNLSRNVAVDTTRYAIIGIGSAAPMAVEAAAIDPAVAALVLVSPRCEPVERGPMRARLAARALPVFQQISPEDQFDSELTEALYEASLREASRVVEGHGSTGAVLFRRDPGLLPRLSRWIAEHLPAGERRGAPPKTPPGG